jgi:hypothetical protein
LFFGKDIGNGSAVISGPAPPMRHLIAPEQCLTIAFGKCSERTTGPEGFAHITYGSLHAAFLITGADLTGARCEVIVRAQLHQSRVEVDLISSALQHCTPKVVVENDPGLARPVLKSTDMSAQKVLHRLVEEELQIQRPRPGERGDEAGQRTAGAAHCNLTEVSPVYLGLLGGECLQFQERFACRRPQPGHGATQLHDAAGVTAVADHLVNACGAEPRMLIERLADELHIRVCVARTHRLRAVKAIRFDGVADGVGVNIEFAGNGADFPVLGVKVAANLHMRFRADHEFLLPHRGFRGKGSTNRPFLPQTTQRRKGTGSLSGRLRCLTAAPEPEGTVTGGISGVPQPHDAGEKIETEP